MKPPGTPTNVILITADQMRADCIQAVNPHVKTPNIQRLVDNGILFKRSYAPTPVCLPCRSSLVTGQYPSTHGAMHNECTLPKEYPSSVASEFTKAGYYTHIIGKSHLNSMHDQASPEGSPHVFNYGYFRKWHGPWYGFTNADISVGHSTEGVAASMHYRAWLIDHGVDIKRYFGNTAYTAYGAWDLPEEFHASKWIADVTIQAIDRSIALKQPFFLSVNFPDPHNPCMVPEPWASMYDPDKIPRHGFAPGEPESFDQKPGFYKEIVSRAGAYGWHPGDGDIGGSCNVSSLDWSPRQVQENAAAYYGMVSLMDKYIGKILDKLVQCGLADDTLIIFTADHGDFLGDHGMWWKSLVGFEEAMHVPLVASHPVRLPRGKRSDALHSSVDLPATMLSFAGLPVPRTFEGVDQRAAWEDPPRAIRKSVIVEERPYDKPFTLRVIINDTFKLCFYANKQYGELYNMKSDPTQLHNLWDDPAHLHVKLEMVCALLSGEITKHVPQPNATPRLLALLPPGASKRPGFFLHHGRLEASDGDALAMRISATHFGTNLIDVPMVEIIEELIGHHLSIKTSNSLQVFSGWLEASGASSLALAMDDGQIVSLATILDDIIGNDVSIAGWKEKELDGKNFFTLYIHVVG